MLRGPVAGLDNREDTSVANKKHFDPSRFKGPVMLRNRVRVWSGQIYSGLLVAHSAGADAMGRAASWIGRWTSALKAPTPTPIHHTAS